MSWRCSVASSIGCPVSSLQFHIFLPLLRVSWVLSVAPPPKKKVATWRILIGLHLAWWGHFKQVEVESDRLAAANLIETCDGKFSVHSSLFQGVRELMVRKWTVIIGRQIRLRTFLESLVRNFLLEFNILQDTASGLHCIIGNHGIIGNDSMWNTFPCNISV